LEKELPSTVDVSDGDNNLIVITDDEDNDDAWSNQAQNTAGINQLVTAVTVGHVSSESETGCIPEPGHHPATSNAHSSSFVAKCVTADSHAATNHVPASGFDLSVVTNSVPVGTSALSISAAGQVTPITTVLSRLASAHQALPVATATHNAPLLASSTEDSLQATTTAEAPSAKDASASARRHTLLLSDRSLCGGLTAEAAADSETAEPFQFNTAGFDYTKYTDMIKSSVAHMLEEFCHDTLNGDVGSAIRKHMQLEIKRLEWQHQREIAEIQHNAELKLAEQRLALENDRDAALDELREQLVMEKQREVAETKKKQWCAYCGKEAIFYCCWNTSYCDYACQKADWPEHMHSCAQPQETATIATVTSSQAQHQFGTRQQLTASRYDSATTAGLTSQQLRASYQTSARYQPNSGTSQQLQVAYGVSSAGTQYTMQPWAYTAPQMSVVNSGQPPPVLQVQYGSFQNTPRQIQINQLSGAIGNVQFMAHQSTSSGSVAGGRVRFIPHQSTVSPSTVGISGRVLNNNSSGSGGGMILVRPTGGTGGQQQMSAAAAFASRILMSSQR
jgi:hypothetical protein